MDENINKKNENQEKKEENKNENEKKNKKSTDLNALFGVDVSKKSKNQQK
jgi:23S rRNA maturation mini-RNase III